MSKTEPLLQKQDDEETAAACETGVTAHRKRGVSAGEQACDAYFEKRYAEMFPKGHRSRFGRNMKLAIRGASFVLLLGIPLILPKDAKRMPDAVNWFQAKVEGAGIFDSGTIVLFVYTLYFNVGSTIDLARGGYGGAVLASFSSWLMWGVGGAIFGVECVKEFGMNGPSIFGLTYGVVFTLVVLYLNLAKNVQVFCLSYFVFYWMAFLQPGTYKDYCHSFKMPWECIGNGHKTTDMAPIFSAFGGVMLAIIATLVPYPMFAITQARETAMESVRVLCGSWDHCVDAYCSDHSKPKLVDRVVHDMHGLYGKVAKLEGYLADAWWECLGKGKIQRSRVMLNRLDMIIHENYDRLQVALFSCQREDFNENHVALMTGCKNELFGVLDRAKALFAYSTCAATDGDIDNQEEAQMRALIEETKHSIHVFSDKFRAVRKSKIGKEVSDDLLDEHAFSMSICAFGRLSFQFAEELLAYDASVEGRSKSIPEIEESPGLKSIFDPKVNNGKDNLSYMLRNSLSVFICMVIGYVGFQHPFQTVEEVLKNGTVIETTKDPAPVLNSLNAGIASTVCVLFSKSAGSAMTKNLGRVQGVVLASVLGQLAFGLLGQCTLIGYAAVGLALWLWLSTTLFIYYHSETSFSYIGCLLAAFGAGYFLIGCDSQTYDPIDDSYAKTTSVVVAITVMTIIDLMFGGKRSCLMAHEELIKAFDMIGQSLVALVDPDQRHVEFHRGALNAQIGLAKLLGDEAALEPRFWRVAWKKGLFDHAVSSAMQLRRFLNCMEQTAQTQRKSSKAENKRPKNRVFQKAITEMQNLRQIALKFQARLKLNENLLLTFLHESEGDENLTKAAPFVQKYHNEHKDHIAKAVKDDFPASWNDGKHHPDDMGYGPTIRRLLQGEIEDAEGAESNTVKGLSHLSLEQDPTCQVCFNLSNMSAMLDEMTNLQHDILQN